MTEPHVIMIYEAKQKLENLNKNKKSTTIYEKIDDIIQDTNIFGINICHINRFYCLLKDKPPKRYLEPFKALDKLRISDKNSAYREELAQSEIKKSTEEFIQHAIKMKDFFRKVEKIGMERW